MTNHTYRHLSDQEFEVFIAHIFERMGYKTRLRGKTNTPNGGVDVEGRSDDEYAVVQCKRWAAKLIILYC